MAESAAERFEKKLATSVESPGSSTNFLSRTLGGVADFVTGADRTEFPNVPELGIESLPAGETFGGYDFLSAASADETEQANIAQQMFGGTLSTDKFDNIMINLNGQDYYINKPGFSGRDAKDIVGQGVMFIPAARVAGAAVQAGRGLANVAGASALTQGAMEAATAAAGADQSPMSMGADVTLSSILGPLSAVPGVRQTQISNRLPPFIQQNAEEGLDLARAQGIGLLSSQLGPARDGEAKIQLLREMPQTAYGMDDALNTQSRQIQQATEGVLAPLPQTSSTPGVQAKDAVVAAQAAAVKEREDATGALYDTIRAQDTQVDTTPLRNALIALQRTDKMQPGGQAYGTIEKIKTLLGTETKRVQKQAPGQADEVVEVEVGSILEPGNLLSVRDDVNTMIAEADKAKNASQIRILKLAKQELDKVLSASTRGVFDEANSIYEALSQPVNAIESGLSGQILNLPADAQDFVAQLVFAGGASPTARRNLQRILNSQDPNAYGALLRAHLEDKLSTINDTAIDQNLPARMLNVLWKNEKTRNLYKSELERLSPDAAETYVQLGEVLKYAKIGRGSNSNTAIKQDFLQRYGPVLGSMILRIPKMISGLGMVDAADAAIAAGRKQADLDRELQSLSGDFKEVYDYIKTVNPGNAKKAMASLLSLQSLTAAVDLE